MPLSITRDMRARRLLKRDRREGLPTSIGCALVVAWWSPIGGGCRMGRRPAGSHSVRCANLRRAAAGQQRAERGENDGHAYGVPCRVT